MKETRVGLCRAAEELCKKQPRRSRTTAGLYEAAPLQNPSPRIQQIVRLQTRQSDYSTSCNNLSDCPTSCPTTNNGQPKTGQQADGRTERPRDGKLRGRAGERKGREAGGQKATRGNLLHTRNQHLRNHRPMDVQC